MKKIPLILDVDTGIDDAVAIVFAHALKNIDLQLITTIYGNVPLEQANHNTLVICDDCNCKTKVVQGEKKPIKPTDFSISAHGKNGLGSYTHEVSRNIDPENYIDAMHSVIAKNELTNIVCCGPLTNVAKYISAHPEDNDKIRIIMVTGLLDIDPQNPYLNFNIAKDFESFKITLKTYKNIVFVPSDMGHQSFISRNDFHKTAESGKMGKILANIYPFHMDRTVKDGAALHDLCGVLWLSNPELFTTQQAFTKVKSTQNVFYVDFNTKSKRTNTLVTTNINVEQMHKIYYETLTKMK